MNWSTAILLFLAWQLLSNNTQSSPKIQDIAPFLNEDTRGILDGVTKLSSPTATSEDKTGAIFQMMTNPTIMSFAQNLFGGNNSSTSTCTPPATQQSQRPQSAPQAPFHAPTSTLETPTATTYSGQSQQGDTATYSAPYGQFAPQTTIPQADDGTTQSGIGQQGQSSSLQGGYSAPQAHTPTQSQDYQNDEGYTFPSPTERAKQFFAPIDTIATAEVKHKLCYFYDNWYLAK